MVVRGLWGWICRRREIVLGMLKNYTAFSRYHSTQCSCEGGLAFRFEVMFLCELWFTSGQRIQNPLPYNPVRNFTSLLQRDRSNNSIQRL